MLTMEDKILTIQECLDDIQQAQKSLEKAHYHLRIALELSEHYRIKIEKQDEKAIDKWTKETGQGQCK